MKKYADYFLKLHNLCFYEELVKLGLPEKLTLLSA